MAWVGFPRPTSRRPHWPWTWLVGAARPTPILGLAPTVSLFAAAGQPYPTRVLHIGIESARRPASEGVVRILKAQQESRGDG